MKELQTIQQENKLNDVFAVDEPGPGGVCHKYQIYRHGEVYYDAVDKCLSTEPRCEQEPLLLGAVQFQCGPRNESGSQPGVTEMDLLEIVRDRLKDFQNGAFRCHENVVALSHVSAALHNLNARTQDRVKRGVLGANAP